MNWEKIISDEKLKNYFKNLEQYIDSEYQNHTIYPLKENIFKAFNLTPLEDVKVVILGQDPYHQPNQAMGLSFSVSSNVKIPPSLVNIFKEINNEYGYMNTTGDLSSWATQGVLLLNTVLTVRDSEAGSHRNKGWEIFTDYVIKVLDSSKENIVFMLWGNDARKKKSLINNPNHLILESSHPSPLGAYRGFNGCNHFRLANEFLLNNGYKEINWKI